MIYLTMMPDQYTILNLIYIVLLEVNLNLGKFWNSLHPLVRTQFLNFVFYQWCYIIYGISKDLHGDRIVSSLQNSLTAIFFFIVTLILEIN